MSNTGKRPGIAVVLSGFPRRSETFALNEVLALDARGLLTAVFATKPGDGKRPHPGFGRLQAPVHLLQGENAATKASHLVACLSGRPVAGIHAYFSHLPAEVAAHAARQLNVPYSFSAHARDIRKVPPKELARRAYQAASVVVCNHDAATTLEENGSVVQLIPHGVDSQHFRPRPFPPAEPFRLLAVGRLVEKKGFAVLIQAVAQLSVPFRLRLVGEGPEQEELVAAVHAARLVDQVEFCGSQTHAELPQEYADAHVVVVPSIVDSYGDRDGLPNVVLEAMASGRPVVASDIGDISHAVVSGYSGFLVYPGDVAALVGTLEWLADQPLLWPKLGRNGRARVERDFELGACTERFCRFLESTYSGHG